MPDSERDDEDPTVADLDVDEETSEEVTGGTSPGGPVPIPYPN
jgi:hypothetical protein